MSEVARNIPQSQENVPPRRQRKVNTLRYKSLFRDVLDFKHCGSEKDVANA